MPVSYPERYVNNFITALTAAITTAPAAGTVENWTVASPAPAALQATGQFRVIIDSEILLVTTGASTTTWTFTRGQEGTTPTTHLNGAAVVHGITVQSLLSLPPEAGIGSLVVYGDSLSSAVAVSSADLRASSLLAQSWGAEEVNRSLGGAVLGWDDTTVNPGGVSYLAQLEVRHRKIAPYRSGLAAFKLAYGTNDLATLGMATTGSAAPTAQGKAIFKNALRTAITLCRSSARFYCGATAGTLDGSIVLGGSGVWTAQPGGAMASGKRGLGQTSGSDGYRSNPTSAATVTITIPGDYPGSALCPLYVMFVCDPTLTAGTITASGAATGTFDLFQNVGGKPGTCDNTRTGGVKCLNVWRFTGNAIAANTNGAPQTLVLTSSGMTGGPWGVAEWGIESDQPPVGWVRSIPYGDPFGSFYANISKTDVDAWNTASQQVVAEFDAFMTYVDVTSVLPGTGGLDAPHSTLNGAITAGSPATGGTLTLNNAANAAGFASTGVILVSPGTPGGEYIAYSGLSSGNLTGITRGAYGSTAQSWGNATALGQSNASALQNWGDGLHLSDEGHRVEAYQTQQTVTPLLAGAIPNIRRNARGRAECKWKLTCSYDQLCNANAQTQTLAWDSQIRDTANQHSPGAGVGESVATPAAGSNNVITIQADGHYQGKVQLKLTQGKYMSSGGNSMPGIRQLFLYRNVNTNIIASQTIFPAYDDLNAFILPTFNMAWDDELHVGDTLWLALYCQYSSANDYHGSLANAWANTTLNGTITSAAATLVATSGTGFVVNDYIRLDDEIMQVTAVATNTLTVTRGVLGSVAAGHTTGAKIWSGVGLLRDTFSDKYGVSPIWTGYRVGPA